MKNVTVFASCLIIFSLILAMGCIDVPIQNGDQQSQNVSQQSQNVILNSSYSAYNSTYSNFGISFEYPANLVPVELGNAGDPRANMNNGIIQLKGTSDNIAISWSKTNHVPPNIPLLYQSMWPDLRQNTAYSNMQIYLLNTYSSQICGNPAFIGRWSYYDKIHRFQANEGIIMWNNPSQDRYYKIDIASPDDYYSSVLGKLTRLQQSFSCAS